MTGVGLVHVISGLGIGGAELMLAALAPRLAARGWRQTVISLTGEGPVGSLLREAGIDVAALDLRRIAASPVGILRLRRIIAASSPAIVQGWMYHGNLAASLAATTTGRRARVAWGIRCSDMDVSRYEFGLRAVITLGAWLSNWPDLIIANSEQGRRSHVAAGYAAGRFVVVHNGIDVERFRPDPQARAAIRESLGLSPDASLVVHVARVDPMKDHETFIAAMRTLKSVTAVLVGAGTEALALPANVRALGRREDVARILAAGDLVVSSSAFGEGFANALAEGMACALAAVATDVGDAALIVGDTGAVVRPADATALAAAMSRLLDEPPAARAARRAASRARIVELFALDRAVAQFDARYRALAGIESA